MIDTPSDPVMSVLMPPKSKSEFSSTSHDLIDSESESEADTNILESLISNLDNKQSSKKRKRDVNTVITEASNESEYNITSNSKSSKKVALNELVQVLQDTTSFGGLKKHLEKIEHNSNGIGSTVSAPLPKRAIDRLNREAAFDQAKKEIRRWGPLIQKNRQADSLSFPMNAPPSVNVTSASLTSQFEPRTEMETRIQKILEDSNLTEKKQMKQEELEMNKLTKEEVINRRAELAKMRSLMFFEEQKNKKIAKIKSKTYRKIQKKVREKNSAASQELDLDQLRLLDPEAANERLIALERERALERMTLKHKNGGKWAKKMNSRRDVDVDVFFTNIDSSCYC